MQTYGLATLSHDGGAPFAALVKGDKAIRTADLGFGDATVLQLLGRWEEVAPALAAAADTVADAGTQIDGHEVHAPYVPGQIFCTGANYKKHVLGLMRDETMRNPTDAAMTDEERLEITAKRLDERGRKGIPYCFVKLPSCVVGPNDQVVLPRNVEKPDWELELGVVIGKRARHVVEAEAMDYVAGFVVVNDVTARELVFRRDGTGIGADWLSGKCFPTFLPFGPYIVPRACIADPYDLNIRLSVNGKIYQDESTSDMLINIEKQVAFLSERVALMPGDVICTGSPYGNGSAFGVCLQPGDVMEGTINGLGGQRNLCVAEA